MANEKLPQITPDPTHHASPLGDQTADAIGPGVGALVGGAATGALAGAIGGPITAIAGAALGAVAGGLMIETIEEALHTPGDDEYWRNNFQHRPYVEAGASYDIYRSAYQYGWESRARFPGRKFDEVEEELARGWADVGQPSSLTWDQAKPAARDAWERH